MRGEFFLLLPSLLFSLFPLVSLSQTHPQRGIQRALAQRRHPPPPLEPAHERSAPSFLFPSGAAGAAVAAVAEREPHGARPAVLLDEQPRADLAPERPQPPPPVVVDGDRLRAEKVVGAQHPAVGDRRDGGEDVVVVRGGENGEDLVVREVDAGMGLDLRGKGEEGEGGNEEGREKRF